MQQAKQLPSVFAQSDAGVPATAGLEVLQPHQLLLVSGGSPRGGWQEPADATASPRGGWQEPADATASPRGGW